MGFTVAEAVELPNGLSGTGLFASLGGDYRTRKLETKSASGNVQYSITGTLCYFTDQYKSKPSVWKRPVSTNIEASALGNNQFETLYTTCKALHDGATITDIP